MFFFPVFMGMKTDGSRQIRIHFTNSFGNEDLELDSGRYKNELGQSLTISKFRYYIGNISLRSDKNKAFVQKGYWLVDAAEDGSEVITLNNVPEDKYGAIAFTIGVDSIDNCSGAQAGALDPVNGMFWAWNTGYIFAKLEGNSPNSTSPGHIFEFHIGGYKSPNNCIRQVLISLDSLPVTSVANGISDVFIRADASEFMKTPTTIDLSKISSVTGPQHATTIADNYSDMFRLIKVKNAQ